MQTRFAIDVESNMGASFSDDRKHRFILWRHLGDGPGIMIVGLNPSTADEEKNDPTIRREIGFARDWGYGHLWKLNLFSLKSTDPKVLYEAETPQHPDNICSLKAVRGKVDLCVVAWGHHGAKIQPEQQWPLLVAKILEPVYCFGLTANGQPKHPLYLPKDTKLIPYILQEEYHG